MAHLQCPDGGQQPHLPIETRLSMTCYRIPQLSPTIRLIHPYTSPCPQCEQLRWALPKFVRQACLRSVLVPMVLLSSIKADKVITGALIPLIPQQLPFRHPPPLSDPQSLCRHLQALQDGDQQIQWCHQATYRPLHYLLALCNDKAWNRQQAGQR